MMLTQGNNTSEVIGSMGMNTPISSLVLHDFYRIFMIEFASIVLCCVGVWLLLRQFPSLSMPFRPLGNSFETNESSRAVSVRKGLTIALGSMWILDGLLQVQPEMSTQFIPGLVGPLISGLPGFLPKVLSPLVYVWTLHPLTFDSLAAWLQILVGTSILFGSARMIGRLGLYASIGWALLIWVVGEGFGVFGGATWLTGAPGAALLYGVAAVAILQPTGNWSDGTVRRGLQISVGALWLICAFLQALPLDGFWQAQGLQQAELSMAQVNQPTWMAAPLYAAARIFASHPASINGVFVLILLGLGLLWIVRPTQGGLSIVTLAFTFLTWWIGQDFGVVGGMGTDLNTGGPLLMLLVTERALRTGFIGEIRAADHTTSSKVRESVGFALGTSAFAMVSLSLFGVALARANTTTAVQGAAVDAGLTPIHIPLPNLTLTNQFGKTVSLAQFRGKAVVLTFLDPVCYEECPLIAREMMEADKLLGPYSGKVEMVAIAANPVFHSVKDLAQFDNEENLGSMANWTYLTSRNIDVLKAAWHKMYEYVSVPKLGMVQHAENMYFISPSGEEVGLVQANGAVSGSGSFSAFIADYVQKQLLGVVAPLSNSQNVHLQQHGSGLTHSSGFDSVSMITILNGWATAFVQPYQEVLHTTDGGHSWINVTPRGITQRGGMLIAATSQRTAWALLPQYGYLANATLLRTTDGGLYWSRVGYPGPVPTMYGGNALSRSPNGWLWLTGVSNKSGYAYLFRSTDEAKRWTRVELPVPNRAGKVTTDPIHWTSRQDGEMAMQTARKRYESTYVMRTMNGGKTWTRASSSAGSTSKRDSVLLKSTGGQLLTVVSQLGTRDAGSNGSVVHVLPSGMHLIDAITSAAMWGIRTVDKNGVVVYSKDGGRTWNTLATTRDIHERKNGGPA